MLDMATDPSKTKRGRKRIPEEAKYTRTGANLNIWLPKELLAAFEEMRKSTRRSKTAEVEVMMEQYLKGAGFWPPKTP